MEHYGIANLQKAIMLGCMLGMQTEEAMKDGFQKTEIFKFLDELMLFPDVLNNVKNIVNEGGDLSAEEMEQLKSYISTTLNLENDGLESVIEKAAKLILDIFGLGKEISSLKKAA